MLSGRHRLQFVPQPRDFDLLCTLLESRVMTRAHAAALHFDGSAEAAKKRIQILKRARLIAERPRRPSEAGVLYLARRGLLLLREAGILAEYPALNIPVLERRARVSDLTIRHELEVMDVKVAFHSAMVDSPRLSIEQFCTWPTLNQFEVRGRHQHSNVLVRPDGFIRIHERTGSGLVAEHNLFLEVDLSTETLDRLVSRATSYFDYYRSGGFAARNGASRASFREHPFRVLFVFKTTERRDNFAKELITHNPPILTQAWLTTTEEVRSNPIGRIWTRPIGYRDKPTNGGHARNAPRDRIPSRHESARENLKGREARKRELFFQAADSFLQV